MLDVMVGIFLAVFAFSLLKAIAARLWFEFRWHRLGWRPKILDPAVVEHTVEECATLAVETDVRDAEQQHGCRLSDAEKGQHLERVRAAFRMVIEQYVENFAKQA